MTTPTADRSALRSIVALVSALGLGVGGLLLGTILSVIVGLILLFLGVELTPLLTILLGLVFIQGIGCAGVALAYVGVRPSVAPAIRQLLGVDGTRDSFRIGASVPDLEDLAVVVAGYVLALGGAMAGSLVVSLLSVDTGRNQGADLGIQNPEVLLLLIPASIFVVGPGEELLFRGVVQGRLREAFGPVVGVLVPSVAFAGVHWFALTGGSLVGNLLAVSVLVVPAVVFGASYEYTGNVVVPVLIHGVYNATLFSMLYVAVVVYDEEFTDVAFLGLSSIA